jgi:hypothetical protein
MTAQTGTETARPVAERSIHRALLDRAVGNGGPHAEAPPDASPRDASAAPATTPRIALRCNSSRRVGYHAAADLVRVAAPVNAVLQQVSDVAGLTTAVIA